VAGHADRHPDQPPEHGDREAPGEAALRRALAREDEAQRGEPDAVAAQEERPPDQREKPLDALGGILNGLGAGFGILALYWWPLFLGATGIGLAGMSLVFARERGIQSRFAWGFAIAGLGWLIGMMLGVYGHKPLSP
jgi:hypothetical protein